MLTAKFWLAMVAAVIVTASAIVIRRRRGLRSMRRLLPVHREDHARRWFTAWRSMVVPAAVVLVPIGIAVPALRMVCWGAASTLSALLVVDRTMASHSQKLHTQRLVADLPRFMELVTVAVAGGLSLEGALLEGSRKHRGQAGAEFRSRLEAVEAGEGLADLLRVAARETTCREFRAVCKTLASALLLGVPAAEVLAELSEFIGRSHRSLLEERVRILPLRLTLIALFLLLPPVVALVLLPNVVAFFQSSW